VILVKVDTVKLERLAIPLGLLWARCFYAISHMFTLLQKFNFVNPLKRKELILQKEIHRKQIEKHAWRS
jgi:hypothetical protein